MALRLRVKGGTRPDKRLCDSCNHSLVIWGSQQGQEKVYCSQIDPIGGDKKEIPFPVVQCSGYDSKGQMSEWDAKQIGWVLEVKGGKVMGFAPPKKEYQNG